MKMKIENGLLGIALNPQLLFKKQMKLKRKEFFKAHKTQSQIQEKTKSSQEAETSLLKQKQQQDIHQHQQQQSDSFSSKPSTNGFHSVFNMTETELKQYLLNRRHNRYVTHQQLQNNHKQSISNSLLYLTHASKSFITYQNLDKVLDDLLSSNNNQYKGSSIPAMIKHSIISPQNSDFIDARSTALKDELFQTVNSQLGKNQVSDIYDGKIDVEDLQFPTFNTQPTTLKEKLNNLKL